MEVKCTSMTEQKHDFTREKCTFSTPLSPLAPSRQHSQATALFTFSMVLTYGTRVRAVLLFF